jgi:hypothetical protein
LDIRKLEKALKEAFAAGVNSATDNPFHSMHNTYDSYNMDSDMEEFVKTKIRSLTDQQVVGSMTGR